MISPPRDFRRGKFKIRSTDPTQPISNQELFDTLTRGMPGSSMPSYRFLKAEERWHLVAYVLQLAGLLESKEAEPVVASEPPPTTPQLIAEGREAYDELGCGACHGKEGRGDGIAAAALKDEWGNADPPRDLTREPFRGGRDAKDVYLRLHLGMPGTPMPGYADVATERQLWALVAFMDTLWQSPEPPRERVGFGAYVVQLKWCTACHRLNGQGGRVGPDLNVALRKLRSEWMRSFLRNPHAEPKIYPLYGQRMPQLFLDAEEIEGVLHYLASATKETLSQEPTRPAPSSGRRARGRELYEKKCVACHAFGDRVAARLDQHRGPDLSRAPARLRYDFLTSWLENPINVHPLGGLPLPEVTADDIEALRAFIWSEGSEDASATSQPQSRR
jgi:mono/diheme cytochrome c family protein